MADQAPRDPISFLDYYLVTKAPFQLPQNAKEAIVKYGPWIAVVLLCLLLPSVLLVLGFGAFTLPFAVFGPAYAAQFGFLTILAIVEFGLLIAALPGLFARRMAGWQLIFYSRLLSIVILLLSGLVINAIVSGLVSLYILFQVRSLYEVKPAQTHRHVPNI